MPLTVFAVVLLAAFLHAAWNAVVKGGGDKMLSTVMVAVMAGLMAAVALPALPQPAAASWPFIAASVGVHVVYFALVARIYRNADMSLTYPLMRGCAPLLVALASVGWLGEHLSALAWGGIAVISLGILAMAGGARGARGVRGGREGVWLALLNALVIAIYTLIDGTGVRRSGAPVAYAFWIFLLTAVPLAAWALATRRPELAGYVRRNLGFALVGGGGTLASYALSLWAMTRAPVAPVAALRESSILFGALISALLLKERVGAARLGAACLIAAGVATLRFA
ncbi:EamA family transporter [Cupriavidus necator]|uniref:EamA family transporter n=1 Tax=Cupriavidus necator TaxID=106590 RepID=UPI00277DEE2F|nr:EamA family transporter [Cupriavidus necator]MDQ0140427.1 drug/metabolite transporter (DMT)-like permease [Cupriavidus necator]